MILLIIINTVPYYLQFIFVYDHPILHLFEAFMENFCCCIKLPSYFDQFKIEKEKKEKIIVPESEEEITDYSNMKFGDDFD